MVSEIRKKDEEGLIDYNVCVRKFTLYKKKLPKLYKEKPSLKPHLCKVYGHPNYHNVGLGPVTSRNKDLLNAVKWDDLGSNP